MRETECDGRRGEQTHLEFSVINRYGELPVDFVRALISSWKLERTVKRNLCVFTMVGARDCNRPANFGKR